MTTWWWVRHGPTHEKTMVGWRDVPADLSDRAAIERLRAHLPEDALLVSSDLARCSRTADAISGGRTRLTDSRELREFNFGTWDGLGFEQVSALDPELSRQFWENPGDVSAPDGESWNNVAGRVDRFVTDLNNRFQAHHIIVVAHIGVIMTQIARAGAMGANQALGHKLDNLSVTRLHHDAGNWDIQAINHVP